MTTISESLVIGDHDDPDIQGLRAAEENLRHFPLALPAEHYRLTGSIGGTWRLTAGRNVLSSEDFADAATVLFRRWRSSPPVPTASVDTISDAAHRDFAERQWESTILGLLHTEYAKNPHVWSRDPLHVDNKVVTLALAARCVRVPATALGCYAPPVDRPQVWKPIDVDQSCGSGRASTIAVVGDDLDVRQPCPGFYQEAIESAFEIRVGFAFGVVVLIAQYPLGCGDLPVDRRYADHRREQISIPELAEEAAVVARALGLKVFTADVLVDITGVAWWCDINPDGLFCAADSADGDLLGALHQGLHAPVPVQFLSTEWI